MPQTISAGVVGQVETLGGTKQQRQEHADLLDANRSLRRGDEDYRANRVRIREIEHDVGGRMLLSLMADEDLYLRLRRLVARRRSPHRRQAPTA